MKKYFYVLMMVAGIILPYTQFVPWSMEGGKVGEMIKLAFANQISGGITLDALIVGFFLLGLMFFEHKDAKVKKIWIPIAGLFIFGIAFAFPCYFYLKLTNSKRTKSAV